MNSKFAAVLVLSLVSVAHAAPREFYGSDAYLGLKLAFNKRFHLAPQPKSLPSTIIPSSNCAIEIVEDHNVKESWGWDEFFIKVSSGNQKMFFNALPSDGAQAFEAGVEFKFVDYQHESEEGHLTGPLYWNGEVVVSDSHFKVSTRNGDGGADVIDCDLTPAPAF